MRQPSPCTAAAALARRASHYTTKPTPAPPASSVLDIWAAGTGLTRTVLFLERGQLSSSKVELNSKNRDLVRILSGPDADAWYH